jgi:hypothetical protein
MKSNNLKRCNFYNKLSLSFLTLYFISTHTTKFKSSFLWLTSNGDRDHRDGEGLGGPGGRGSAGYEEIRRQHRKIGFKEMKLNYLLTPANYLCFKLNHSNY